MKRFVEGVERSQSTLFPERLEDWIGDDNAVRVVDVFVDELDLGGLGFGRVAPRATGRPGYHPSVSGSKAQRSPLLAPICGSAAHQVLELKRSWLLSVQDCLNDIGRE